MIKLELDGLKAHHPLGFLAACGLLRCCTPSKQFGLTRLGWQRREDGNSWVAALQAERGPTVDELVRALEVHAESVSVSPALIWSTKIGDREKFRSAAADLLDRPAREATDRRGTLDVFAALASDLVTTRRGTLQATMLDLTSGNQRFLSSVRELAQALCKEPSRSQAGPTPAESLREALCGIWQYRDDAHSLGWDPLVQRLHALRHKVPEQDKAGRSVRAAVFLASQALSLFPCFAVGGRLRTRGFHREAGADWFAWPVWREPISLDTLRSLLAHPLTPELRQRGIEMVYRSRRIRTGGAEGNYQVFSHAEEWPWPTGKG